MDATEMKVYRRVAELMGYQNITPVVDVLYGMAPESAGLSYIPTFTRDWYTALSAANMLFDDVKYVTAEDGTYAGVFIKGDQSVEVTSVSGPMLFCTAIIQFYGLENQPKKGKKK